MAYNPENIGVALSDFVVNYSSAIVIAGLAVMSLAIILVMTKVAVLYAKAYIFIDSDDEVEEEELWAIVESWLKKFTPPKGGDSLLITLTKLAYLQSSAYTTRVCHPSILSQFACDDAKKSLDEHFENRFVEPIANWNSLTLPVSLFATVAGLIGVVPHINDENLGPLLATKLITTATGLFCYGFIELLSVKLKISYRNALILHSDKVNKIIIKKLSYDEKG